MITGLDNSVDVHTSTHVRQSLYKLKVTAVKRALTTKDSRSGTEPSSSLSQQNIARNFRRQLHSIEYEVKALCSAPFRLHHNIVKIIGWGLCLDTLEDALADAPCIPLLLLERGESNLRAFLENNRTTTYESLRDICLGIGHGLQAIHRAKWIHGDLKPDNVLIFRDGTTIVPKLCDFGLSQPPEHEESPYLGSYGWAPLKGSQRLSPGRIEQCDVYSYGLLVWSIFTGKLDSPLPPHLWSSENEDLLDDDYEYREEKVYFTASREIQQASMVPASDLNRIKIVLRGSLHGDQRLWQQSPWMYLDASRYRTIPKVSDDATLLMGLVQATQRYSASFKSLIAHSTQVYPVLFPIYLTQGFLSHTKDAW